MMRTAARSSADARWFRSTLAELVRFRSDRPGDRRPIAAWMERQLRALGAHVSRHGTPGSPALLASFGPGGVLFSGHIDTVPATGLWKTRPAEIRGGRLYGRGSTDMKGGVTAILGAARALAGRVPFSVAITTDEEVGMDGARAMLKHPRLKKVSAVVVAEPSGLRVGLAEKAVHQVRLETSGRSAHASMPWTGISATARMGRLLEHLHAAHPSRDRAGITFNVGRISGGVKTNVIADQCEADLDFRLPGARTPGPHEARLRRILRPLRIPYRLRRLHFLTSLAQDESHPLLQRFCRVAGRPTGTIYFATEAAVFAALRKPQIIFGPGAQERAHVTDEWVALKEVEEASRVYREFALTAGEGR